MKKETCFIFMLKHDIKNYFQQYRKILSFHLASTQYSGNIRYVFPQRCNVRDIQGTFREHFKGKDFLKSSRWKSCFCVKSV